MLVYIAFADRLSAWFGKAFAWLILVMAIGVGYEVLVRYGFNSPTDWAFDLSYIMYGTLFMMGGAYTLSRGGHVRADIFYRRWPVRFQAGLELVLYILFFFPGVLALVIAGWGYGHEAYAIKEVSVNSPVGVPVWPLKLLIPAAGVLLTLQGIAEVLRCVLCLMEGSWPARLHDVEEMEDAMKHGAGLGASAGHDEGARA